VNSAAVELTAPGDASFIGHPKGLFFLAFTEAWERIGDVYERMGPLQFWLMHAVIGAAGCLLVVLVGHLLSRELQPGARV